MGVAISRMRWVVLENILLVTLIWRAPNPLQTSFLLLRVPAINTQNWGMRKGVWGTPTDPANPSLVEGLAWSICLR